jgi:hypothetical protein
MNSVTKWMIADYAIYIALVVVIWNLPIERFILAIILINAHAFAHYSEGVARLKKQVLRRVWGNL